MSFLLIFEYDYNTSVCNVGSLAPSILLQGISSGKPEFFDYVKTNLGIKRNSTTDLLLSDLFVRG